MTTWHPIVTEFGTLYAYIRITGDTPESAVLTTGARNGNPESELVVNRVPHSFTLWLWNHDGAWIASEERNYHDYHKYLSMRRTDDRRYGDEPSSVARNKAVQGVLRALESFLASDSGRVALDISRRDQAHDTITRNTEKIERACQTISELEAEIEALRVGISEAEAILQP